MVMRTFYPAEFEYTYCKWPISLNPVKQIFKLRMAHLDHAKTMRIFNC